MKVLPNSPGCFICGSKNFSGTNVQFFSTDEGVQCEYHTSEKHISYEGLIHGGILSALLDECLGWAVAIKEKQMVVTGELTIRFNIPVPVNKKIVIKGFSAVNQSDDKKYKVGVGQIVDKEKNVYATAEGKFFPMPDDYEDYLIKQLEFKSKIGQEVTKENMWGLPMDKN